MNSSKIWVQFFLQQLSNFLYAHRSFRIHLSIKMDQIEISNIVMDGLTVAASTLSVAGKSVISSYDLFSPSNQALNCDPLTASLAVQDAPLEPSTSGVGGSVKQKKRKIRRKNSLHRVNANEGSGNPNKRNRTRFNNPQLLEPSDISDGCWRCGEKK